MSNIDYFSLIVLIIVSQFESELSIVFFPSVLITIPRAGTEVTARRNCAMRKSTTFDILRLTYEKYRGMVYL